MSEEKWVLIYFSLQTTAKKKIPISFYLNNFTVLSSLISFFNRRLHQRVQQISKSLYPFLKQDITWKVRYYVILCFVFISRLYSVFIKFFVVEKYLFLVSSMICSNLGQIVSYLFSTYKYKNPKKNYTNHSQTKIPK